MSEEVSREEIAQRAFELKAEAAKRSEEKHKQLQEQFKDYAEKAWFKRFEEERKLFEEEEKLVREQKRIEEAEERERYERNMESYKNGLIRVNKEVRIDSVTLTLTEEEARELLDNIETSVGLKVYPTTILERIGVYLAEELEE